MPRLPEPRHWRYIASEAEDVVAECDLALVYCDELDPSRAAWVALKTEAIAWADYARRRDAHSPWDEDGA